MGYRTVVMLSNDQTDEWRNDPTLGEQIFHAMMRKEQLESGYGRVVECEHGDTQTLAVLDGYYTFTPLGYKNWQQHEADTDTALRLLKIAAEQLGYTLRKKPGA